MTDQPTNMLRDMRIHKEITLPTAKKSPNLVILGIIKIAQPLKYNFPTTRSVQSAGRSVCQSVCHNFLNGQTVLLPEHLLVLVMHTLYIHFKI